MSDLLQTITQIFKGSFVASPSDIQKKLFAVKAFVFDWDGVFNNGEKDEHGASPFNEVDAMGTNLLRFNHYIRNENQPLAIIISGEKNKAAQQFAKRECFNAIYSGFKNKTEALQHVTSVFDINPEEIAFVFDDVLDFSMAAVCGLRIMISRDCNPLLLDFVKKNHLADYITANNGDNGAIREAVELLLGLSGMYDETIQQRMDNSNVYTDYLHNRNLATPVLYVSHPSKSVVKQES